MLAFRMSWVARLRPIFCQDLIMSNIHCNDFEYTKIYVIGPLNSKTCHHPGTVLSFIAPPLKLNIGSICPNIVLGDNIYSYNI